MQIRHPRLRLVLVALLAAATAVALTRFHPAIDGSVWRRGDDLALVAAWVVALASAAWLALATSVCAVSLGLSRPRLATRLAPALPFGVRRLVEVAIVSACIALPTTPAGAAPSPARVAAVVLDEPVVRAAGLPPTTTTLPASAPTSSAPVAASATPTADAPVAAAPAPSGPPTPVAPPETRRPAPSPSPSNARTHVVVRPGDSLWTIARDGLRARGAGAPSEAAVFRYWRAVVAQNRTTLRSGNPGLIFPGEVVTLPAVTGVS